MKPIKLGCNLDNHSSNACSPATNSHVFEDTMFMQGQASAKGIAFHHGNAEDTGLEASSTDLVSICLVLHELPQQATRNILIEAFRILRPGGFLSIMVTPCPSFSLSALLSYCLLLLMVTRLKLLQIRSKIEFASTRLLLVCPTILPKL